MSVVSMDKSPSVAEPAVVLASKPQNPQVEALLLFLRNGTAALGLSMMAIIVVMCLIGPGLYGIDPYAIVNVPFAPPGTPGALFGTDFLGRDILAGVLIGGRPTLIVGCVAAAMTIGIGVLIGCMAGYFGGWIDRALMKFTEFFQVLPALLLAMVIVSIFEASLLTITLAIGIVGWPQAARLTRAEFLRIRDLEYVRATRTAGARDFYLIFNTILPGALPPIIVASALTTGGSILFESGLSFLGLGDPNMMSWGVMIGQNRNYLLEAWWTVSIPGIAIFLTVLAISLIGDGINDALNPRMRKR
ncbi:ABC transporter permease [Devosia sp. XJ19-1]|uniref:ABC transporter permease n=1 Tax=Devosia ureilytica TaxID=2952754 RepID=A0A9Q4FRF7_9HYPH|nr:ABC transporter permease [Devosia ureilytica]MCP8881937.1 ABC transporter permease [Devosia ureilytica]MCP8886177.1 ABC transporter permease [Devosia ureilytica]